MQPGQDTKRGVDQSFGNTSGQSYGISTPPAESAANERIIPITVPSNPIKVPKVVIVAIWVDSAAS